MQMTFHSPKLRQRFLCNTEFMVSPSFSGKLLAKGVEFYAAINGS